MAIKSNQVIRDLDNVILFNEMKNLMDLMYPIVLNRKAVVDHPDIPDDMPQSVKDAITVKLYRDGKMNNTGVDGTYTKTYINIEPCEDHKDWVIGTDAFGHKSAMHASGSWPNAEKTMVTTTRDPIGVLHPQLITRAQLIRFHELCVQLSGIEDIADMDEAMDEIHDRLNRAAPYWLERVEEKDKKMHAIEARRTARPPEPGQELERDPERWYDSDKWEQSHGLGGKMIYLNAWIKGKDDAWRKAGYIKIDATNGFCEDYGVIQKKEGWWFVNRLKAFCRDNKWDGARIVPAMGMKIPKGPYVYKKCYSECCSGKQTRHYVTPTHVKCMSKGCDWKVDREWLEVFFKQGRLDFAKPLKCIKENWKKGDKTLAYSVMLFNDKVEEQRELNHWKKMASNLNKAKSVIKPIDTGSIVEIHKELSKLQDEWDALQMTIDHKDASQLPSVRTRLSEIYEEQDALRKELLSLKN